MSNISKAALEAMKTITVTGNVAKLPEDRWPASVYEEVKRIMVGIGGKYRRSTFEFSHEYPLADTMAAIGETGSVDINPLAFHPTPAAVVYEITRYPMPFGDVLEPSAGQGAIVDCLLMCRDVRTVTAVEMDPVNLAVLRRRFGTDPRVTIVAGDFLNMSPEARFDGVYMNPPFTVHGCADVYIEHIEHAINFLRPDCAVTFIAPASMTHKSGKGGKIEALRLRMWDQGYDFTEVEGGAFETTNTATVIGTVTNCDMGWKREPYAGAPSWYAWEAGVLLENDWAFAMGPDGVVSVMKNAPDFRFQSIVKRVESTKRLIRYLLDADWQYLRNLFAVDESQS